MLKNRTIYYGDNLNILCEKFPHNEGYFDLIYLDPPFNSKKQYNMIFKENQAQIKAFEDSWEWLHRETQDAFDELVGRNPTRQTTEKIADMMIGFEKIIGHNSLLAYLTMMTVRLVELRRVLKETGSIYVHCDPTASHYLKIIMDTIFGYDNFRNEIVWCYKEREISKKHWNKKHDIILFYTKGSGYTFNWNDVTTQYSVGSIKKYTLIDETGRKYQIRGKGGPYVGEQGLKPEIEKEYPEWTYRDYLDEKPGVLARDWWNDIPIINRAAKERLGYPTQKPEALLERIIIASSNEGDWILDPFCGCGTAIAVAERLKRKWVGIDITSVAIDVIKTRMTGHFPNIDIEIDGTPTDVQTARLLAEKDKFQFQYWVISQISGAMPQDYNGKKGADQGVDGIILFDDIDENNQPTRKKIIVQVKGGANIQDSDISKLVGTVQDKDAVAGLFVTLSEPSKPMVSRALRAGTFKRRITGDVYPKMQILTVEELLDGKKPHLPSGMEVATPIKEAQKHKKIATHGQAKLIKEA